MKKYFSQLCLIIFFITIFFTKEGKSEAARIIKDKHHFSHVSKTKRENFSTDKTLVNKHEGILGSDTKALKDFKEFLTVHIKMSNIPLVLIILAMLTQIGAMFFYKKQFSGITLILLFLGFGGAVVIGLHGYPNTQSLDELTFNVFHEHQYYIVMTIWVSGVGLFIKGISHFFAERKLWMEAIVCFMIIRSAYCMSVAFRQSNELMGSRKIISNVKVEEASFSGIE